MELFESLRKMNLLLIDDDDWVRDSLSLFFKSEGCHILALASAEEALAALKNQTFDIIISDYRLPGMDGIEFFERLSPMHPGVLKVLITAFGSKEVLSRANDAGIQETILKPFDSDAIETSLNRLIALAAP